MKKVTLLSLLSIAGLAHAGIIYQDGFTTNGSLVGASTDDGAGTWGGYASSWSNNAGYAVINSSDYSGNRNAYLSFVPVSGKIYEYSVTYEIMSGEFGIGFVTNLTSIGSLGIFQFDAASMRLASGGSMSVGMDNGSIGNSVTVGSSWPASGIMTMILNTTGSQWTVEWKLNDVVITNGTFNSEAPVVGIVISASSATVKLDSLTLQTVPEPATISLFIIAGIVPFLIRLSSRS